jgi:putative MFS transporter
MLVCLYHQLRRGIAIQKKDIGNLEASNWTGYHTYLMIFFSCIVFFGIFMLSFSGLVLNRMAISFSWSSNEVLLIFGIIGISGLFIIIPRYLTDLYGRKPLILIVNVIYFFSIIGYSLAPNTIIFIIFQIIAGIVGVDLYAIIISEEVPARYRARAIGIITGIGMSSALLASYLFTFTGQSEDNWRIISVIMACIALLAIVTLWFKFKETRRFKYYKRNKKRLDLPRQSILKVFKRKYLKLLVLGSLLLFLTDWIYLTIKRYYVLFLIEERVGLGFNEGLIGTWSMFVYIGSILGYYSAGFFADKIGRKPTIYLAILIYFLGSTLFLFISNISIIFFGLFIVNVSFAIYRLVAEILAVIFFPTRLRASGSGWMFVFASLSSLVGNFVMYYFFEILGTWEMLFFIIGTLCLVALAVITFFVPETKERILEEIYFTEIEEFELNSEIGT